MTKVMTLKTEQLHKSSSQIVSKKRVSQHGEVYTAEREVKAMCDLVNDETQRLDSRFLEPACGTGNFLVEILNRKLKILKSKYKNSITDFEKYSVVAVGSIYGVELLSDNVEICKKRLFDLWKKTYQNTFKKKINIDFENVIQFVLNKNILCGNALTLKQVDEKQKDLDKPIVFSEWSFVTGFLIKRRDFSFEEMIENPKSAKQKEKDLFSDLDTKKELPKKAFIPHPIKEFALCDYRKIHITEEEKNG